MSALSTTQATTVATTDAPKEEAAAQAARDVEAFAALSRRLNATAAPDERAHLLGAARLTEEQWSGIVTDWAARFAAEGAPLIQRFADAYADSFAEDTSTLPTGEPAPARAPRTGFRPLSFDHYAEFRARLSLVDPLLTMAVAADYGIHDRSGVEATQAIWRQRFADDPDLRERWLRRLREYRARLRG
jgi:hypothetical protein